MNTNKLQTLITVMYNELSVMDKHNGVFIKLYNTTKEEAIEATNALVEAFPKFSDYKYHWFNTNKGYCLVRVHSSGHEEKYDVRVVEEFAYLYLNDALEDFYNIANNVGYTNENGIHVCGDVSDDEDLDGGDFIGQYLGIFKTEHFYYIAGLTKETHNEKDAVYPITFKDGKYICDENVIIEQFKEKPLANKKLKYNRAFDYKYNRGGFIIEEYIHKFNRTHFIQIAKFDAIDTSD